MENQRTRGVPIWLQWVSAISGTLGISVCQILGLFPADNQNILLLAIAAALIATAALGSVSVKSLRQQNQTILDAKDAELETSRQRTERLTAQLAEQAESLSVKDAEIQKLHEAMEVWENILRTQTPAQAGYYMANQERYNRFKTELVVSRCDVDVDLVRNGDEETERNLHFYWTLNVVNPSAAPVSKIKFIYSGDKDDTTYPEVTVNGSPVRVSFENSEKTTGDDRFMYIHYPQSLRQNDTAKVCIEYTLAKYIFNPKYDFIWLVPDALGFAEIRKISIRFFADGKVIRESTSALLRSYRLSGNYPPEIDEPIECQRFTGGRTGFACEKQKEEDMLEGHGYLLILINDRDSLPDFLRNIPNQNTPHPN